MIDALPADIIYDILKISNDLKEKFLDIIHHYNQMAVGEQITKWISKCIEKNISEFIEAAGSISRWKEYILNSFIDEKYSIVYAEGINNKIKVIKRNAFGYKNFELFRERILYIFNDKIVFLNCLKNTIKMTKKHVMTFNTKKHVFFIYDNDFVNYYFTLDFIELFN